MTVWVPTKFNEYFIHLDIYGNIYYGSGSPSKFK